MAKPKSRIMEELYGPQFALTVAERLNDLDPDLAKVILKVPYEQFWTRPGLSLRDKALITVASLIAMGKEEQTRIHMRGFLNAGGTEEELKNALLHLSMYCGFPAVMNGFVALQDVRKASGRRKTRKNRR